MTNRNSSYDLLKIISIFLIVLGHVTWQTNFYYDSSCMLKNVFIQSLWIGGELGVYCFLLISSYYLSTKSFSIRRIKNIWGITLFYSILIYTVLVLLKQVSFNLVDAIKSVFPILTGSYWFISAYIGICILMPFLNRFIGVLDFKLYTLFILICSILFTVVPVFFKNGTYNSPNYFGGTIFNAIFIYFIGGYIKKFEEKFNKKNMKLYIFMFLNSILFMLISIIIINLLRMGREIGHSYGYFLGINSPFQLMAGVALFLIFKNIQIPNIQLISYIAKSTLAVYVIHTQIVFIPLLWNKYLQIYKYESKSYIILIEILVAFIIFFSCILIDKIRLFVIYIYKRIIRRCSVEKI